MFLCRYFTSKFPHLLQVTYQFAEAHCSQDPPLSTYYSQQALGCTPLGQQSSPGPYAPLTVQVDATAPPAADAISAEQQLFSSAGAAVPVKADVRILPGDLGTAPPAVPGNALPAVPGNAPPVVIALSPNQQLAKPDKPSLVDQQGHPGPALDAAEARSGSSSGNVMPFGGASNSTASPHSICATSFRSPPSLPASAALPSPAVSQASERPTLIPETVPQQPAMSFGHLPSHQTDHQSGHQSSHQPVYLAPRATHVLSAGQASMPGTRWHLSSQQPAVGGDCQSHGQHHQTVSEQLPHRPGQSVCSFYAKTGHCKFGQTCKFDHPVEYAVRLNILGLPLRDQVQICPHYMKTGECKYGPSCKFHHPEPPQVQLCSM